MLEAAFLEAMRQFLAGANLQPAPARLGVVDPVEEEELPSVVLSLEDLVRPPAGLGERATLITDGALLWRVTIDLANPVLPEDPAFRLLSPDRLELILPHGGQVKSDGTTGPLDGDDLTVQVQGEARTVVGSNPGANEVTADPLIGKLTFGAPLPGTGSVEVSYHLGQYEQRFARLSGVLQVIVLAEASGDVQQLSEAVASALDQASLSLPGLRGRGILELSSIRRADPLFAGARSRAIRFAFDYELEINRPDSSGGIIQRIPVTANVGGA
jgi:hypothetical protein